MTNVNTFPDTIDPPSMGTLEYNAVTDTFILTVNPGKSIGLGISGAADWDALTKLPPGWSSSGTYESSSPVSDGTKSPSVSTTTDAHTLLQKADNAIATISSALSYIGSAVNRLTYQGNSLTVAMVNTEAARSRIEDADMAYEQLNATKLQILQQTSTAMLAQANISPQSILSLMQR